MKGSTILWLFFGSCFLFIVIVAILMGCIPTSNSTAESYLVVDGVAFYHMERDTEGNISYDENYMLEVENKDGTSMYYIVSADTYVNYPPTSQLPKSLVKRSFLDRNKMEDYVREGFNK